MTKEFLPSRVDPIRFADNGTHLSGALLIKDMDRLIESLSSPEGIVETTMHFGVDEQGLRYLRGSFKTLILLQCQRCLESFKYEIMSNFNLGLVQTEEEAGQLPSHYDPLVVPSGELSLKEVIEDELIVNLPIVPMHSQEECKIVLPFITETDSVQEVEKESPFKVIELLREKRDRNK